jgi:hypothetical protein
MTGPQLDNGTSADSTTIIMSPHSCTSPPTVYPARQQHPHRAELEAGFALLPNSAGGGWIASSWLGGGLPSVFAAVALGFVVFGLGQLAAIGWTLPVPRAAARPVPQPAT